MPQWETITLDEMDAAPDSSWETITLDEMDAAPSEEGTAAPLYGATSSTEDYYQNIQSIEDYHLNLPYPIDTYKQVDEETHNRFIKLNELATGEVYRFSEDKETRAEELAIERQEMLASGIEEPVEWLAQKESEEGPQNLALRTAKEFAEGFKMEQARLGALEFGASLNEWADPSSVASYSHLIRAKGLETQWEEKVQSIKDADALFGKFASGVARKGGGVLGRMAPAIAGSIASGGNPWVFYSLMGGPVGTEAFGRAKTKDWSGPAAATYGAVVAGIEIATEMGGAFVGGKLGVATVTSAILNGPAKGIYRALGGMALEGGEEVFNNYVQATVDFFSGMDEDAFKNINSPETFAIGALVSGTTNIPQAAGLLNEYSRSSFKKLGIPSEIAKTVAERKSVADKVQEATRNHIFSSGLTRSPADMDAAIAEGKPVGVAIFDVDKKTRKVRRVSGPVKDRLVNQANSGNPIFIDSGAFIAFNKGTDVDWGVVRQDYGAIITATNKPNRDNIYVVAPDAVGRQSQTLDLQADMGALMNEWAELGANIIVPVQKDKGGIAEEWASATNQFDEEFSDQWVIGIPFNAEAWQQQDVLDYLEAMRSNPPRDIERVHLLGGGQAKVEAMRTAVADLGLDFPVEITGDSLYKGISNRKGGRGIGEGKSEIDLGEPTWWADDVAWQKSVAKANVAPGYVRMYHGGVAPSGESRFASPDYAYAKAYAKKSGEDTPVWYVDVHEDAPFMKKAFDDEGADQTAPWANTEIPGNLMRGAKEVPGMPDFPSSPDEGMAGVGDLPGSAPRGRFGPLESEAAYRSVETSDVPLVDVKKPISPKDVIDAIEEVGPAFGADVPIRPGLLGRNKGALGYYRPGAATVRLESRFDAGTAAHEIGHAVLRGLRIDSPKLMKQAVGPAAHKEMIALGKELYGDRKPNGGYYNEGLAEFFRYYIARDPARAQAKAPKFFDAFQKLVESNPNGLASMDHARNLLKTWGDQGAIARVDAQMIDTSSEVYKVKAAFRRLKADKGIVRHIEELEPIHEYQQAYRLGGGKLDFAPYSEAKGGRGRATASAERFLEVETTDIHGNHVGDALNEAVKPIGTADRDDFQRYMFANRALALYSSTKGARDPGTAKKDAEFVRNAFHNPRFELAANKVYAWWQDVLDYVAGASPEIAENVARQREQNLEEFGEEHGYYVPLNRVMEEQVRGISSSGGKELSGALSDLLKGSALPVKEVLPQLVAKAGSLMQMAHRRKVADTVFAMHDDFLKDPRNQSLGHYLEPIPEAVVPMDVPVGQVIQGLERVFEKIGLPNFKIEIDSDPNVVAAIEEIVNAQLATFYRRSGKPAGGRRESPIVTRTQDGQMSFYRADPNLYEALMQSTPQSLRVFQQIPVWKQIRAGLVATNRGARAGYVGLRAGFSLVTSPLREAQGLAYHSAETNPLILATDYMIGVYEAGAYAASGGKVELPWMKTLHRLGIQMSSPLAEDALNTKQATRRAFESPTQRTLDVRNWYHFVKDAFQALDAAPRIAEMKRVAREHNWDPSKPLTKEIAQDMGLAGKEITADFSAGSAWSRELNNLFLFYNIAIQGPRAVPRHAKDHPIRFATGIGIGTALTLANWLQNRDEEFWIERNRREDFANVKVKLGEEVLRIPINQEASQIPQAIMVAVDSVYRQDPEAAMEYVGAVMELLAPSLPVAVQWMAEKATNRKRYNDAPVIPQHLLKASPEDQFGTYTAETAKVIGQALGKSPSSIEHTIRTFGGGVGGDLLGLSDKLLGLKESKESSRLEAADTFLVGRLFQRGGIYGTRSQSVDKMFDAYEDAEKRQFSTRNPETLRERELRLQLLDGKKAVTALLNLRTLAPDTKGRRALSRQATKLSRLVVEDYKGGILRREQWQDRRKYLVKKAKVVKERVPTP